MRIGLVTEVVSDAGALEAAKGRIAADILACAPGAVADAKQLAMDVFGREIDHGLLEETARRIAAARVGDEGQEGVRAFLERRKPARRGFLSRTCNSVRDGDNSAHSASSHDRLSRIAELMTPTML